MRFKVLHAHHLKGENTLSLLALLPEHPIPLYKCLREDLSSLSAHPKIPLTSLFTHSSWGKWKIPFLSIYLLQQESCSFSSDSQRA